MIFCEKCSLQYKPLARMEGVGGSVAVAGPRITKVYSTDTLECPGCKHRVLASPDRPYAMVKGNPNRHRVMGVV